jgi:hypothetical protein
MTAPLLAEAPDPEQVWSAVDKAGLPRQLVTLENSKSFPEAVIIGRQNPDQSYQLNAVYLENRYLSPNQASAQMLPKLTPELAVAWVSEVLLAFEKPCLNKPIEFEGSADFVEPTATQDGAGGFRVKLWVREAKEFTLRQYHLTPKGTRLSVQQRRRT